MRYKQVTGDKTTHYIGGGSYEVEIDTAASTTTTRNYIGGYAMKVTQPDGSTKLTYLHKDRLGSVDTITDGDIVASLYNLNDVVLEQRSFNVFGKARTDEGAIAPDGSEGNGELGSAWTPRGFTGHENLDGTGLIHMNGRAYDPNLGRFMSVDPFITFPDNGQSLNPYSYVMNNPLKYTDPSGYAIEIIICGGVDKKTGKLTGGCRGAKDDKDQSGDEGGSSQNNNGSSGSSGTSGTSGSSGSTGSTTATSNGKSSFSAADIAELYNREVYRQFQEAQQERKSGFSLRSAAKAVGSFGASLVPFSEAAGMAMDGDWTGATKSVAIEGGMMIAGVLTAGVAYGAYKTYKKIKSLRKASPNLWRWGNVRRRLGEEGWAKKNQHVHHWLIPQGGKGKLSVKGLFKEQWGRFVPDVIKNRKWNLMPARSRRWHNAVHGKGPDAMGLTKRLWHGSPWWFKPAVPTAGIGLGVGIGELTNE